MRATTVQRAGRQSITDNRRIHLPLTYPMTLSNRWFILTSLLCALLASALFIPGLSGDFAFDDDSNIVNNQAIHLERLDADSLYWAAFSPQPGGETRLLPTISFALDYWRGGGLDPAVFKATNIGIHALTTFALAWFFRNLLLLAGVNPIRARLAALALALAWAMHPLQVSSVLYVVQRMQTMATLFLVLALMAYLKARQAQIQGHSGRTGWLLAGLLWVLSIGCKEDAVLLPAYTLALELTLLRFRAANPALAHKLRRDYQWMAALGAAAFLFVVVPHFWQWDAYPGRDFSSTERLLTQGRVLCMYLWQILLPLPQHMPFYYDWLQPSRGLRHPWTTLPAILLVSALLATAWRLRARRPLFALGVFLFFAGHFVTSNVVGLELAFEHRNHFALIGILLAAGDLLAVAAQRLRLRPSLQVTVVGLLLMLMGSATVERAMTWDSGLGLARMSTELAPHSARAWNSLCLGYYELGGSNAPANPYLDKAIDTCSKGAAAAVYSVSSLTNMLVFKTMQGSVAQADWNRYLERLEHVEMGPENRQTLQILINNVSHGVVLDEDGVLEAIDIVARRGQLHSAEWASIGYFILTLTHQPDRAYPFFFRSVQTASSPRDQANGIIAELQVRGRPEWAVKLEAQARALEQQQAAASQ